MKSRELEYFEVEELIDALGPALGIDTEDLSGSQWQTVVKTAREGIELILERRAR